MNSGSEPNEREHSQNQDVNHVCKDVTKKPTLWWWLIGLLSILLLSVSIALIVVEVRTCQEKEINQKSFPEKYGKEICITSECIREASALLRRIDDSEDPCEDFHKFACGKYAHHVQISLNKEKQSLYDEMNNKLNYDIKDILEQPIKDGDFRGISMARTFYNSCLSKEKPTNMEQFKYDQIHKILGDWPAKVGEWTPPSTYSLEQQVANLLKINIVTLFWVEVVPFNPTQKIIQVKPIHFGMQDSIPKPEPTTESYKADKHRLDLLLKKMDEVRSNENDTKLMSIKEMKLKFNQINWDIILSIFPKQLNITENEIVKIASVNKMDHVLNTIRSAKIRDVQNLMFGSAVYKSQHMPIPDFSFQYCKKDTVKLFESIIVHEYVKKHLDMIVIQEVVNELKLSLIEVLMKAAWLDDTTRKRAVAKAKMMNTLVGQPDENFSEDFLLEYYKEIDVRANDYWNSVQKVEAMHLMQKYKTLRKLNKRNEFTEKLLITNAHYIPEQNFVEIPAAYLVFPVSSEKVPAYLNYGLLGTTIGHEMTHGFDINGHLYNEVGSNEMWWSNATHQQFMRKAHCIETQFNNTKDIVTGHSLNGKKTLKENMADVGAIKLSHMSFMKWLSKNPFVPALPQFEKYTPEQMFFIMFSAPYCELYTENKRVDLLKESEHSLGQYRINLSLKNLREFGDAFNCPKKAKMRLEKRCELW